MPAGRKTLLRYIRRLAARPEADQASDAVLLERFVATHDERAFAALVERHGTMVLQVCRWVLGDANDAEDAFQGTFLVLARKAATVRPPEALSAWLHGVARRVALKARAARCRRWQRTRPLLGSTADRRRDPLTELSARELLTIVDEEVQHLPEKYRLPVVLCCLSGRSLEEAARQLGWTVGSVKGRLERGRARLHDRLVRRGLTLAVALAALEASRATAPAAVIAGLVAHTVPGALAFGACQTVCTGVSAAAVMLASQVVKTMALARLTVAAGLLLAVAVLGAGFALHRATLEPATPNAPNQGALAALANIPHPAGRARDNADVPIHVTGRILDPRGQPVAGAELSVGYSVRRYIQPTPQITLQAPHRPTSYPRRATTAPDGRFDFQFATSELDARELDDARPAVMAVAAGYGPAWAEVYGPATDVTLQLVADFPASGRVLDAKHQPVAGVKLVVQRIYSAPVDALNRYLKGNEQSWAPRCWRGPLPGAAPPIMTDADGRWRCTGLGRDRIVTFALDGPKVPDTLLSVATRPAQGTPFAFQVHAASSDYVAPPLRAFQGVVRDQATGSPIAGVEVTVRGDNAPARTGPDGRFEIYSCPRAEGYLVMAQPPEGQGYFATAACAKDSPGPRAVTVDFSLVRGIALWGKVIDRSTGKPPRSAVVEYHPLFPNPHIGQIMTWGDLPASTAVVRPDGSYHLAVLPGPGVVSVAASPRDAYATATITDKELAHFLHDDKPDGEPYLPIALGVRQRGVLPINKYNAVALVHPAEKAQAMILDLPLQQAHTLHGTVLGPDGQPLTGVEVVGLTAQRTSEMLEGASFTITGLGPKGSRKLIFRHRAKKLGQALTIRGDTAQPLKVQLGPCGTVRGRVVDPHGQPVPGMGVFLGEDDGPSWVKTKTDRQGRFQMELFPGQTYSWGVPGRFQTRLGKVQVGAGENKDLGDLRLRSEIRGRRSEADS